MLLSPAGFPRDDVLDRYDPSTSTTNWGEFKDCLHQFFMRFHTVEKQKKRHRLFQDHTVLAYYSMEDGSYHKDETEVDSNDVVRVLILVGNREP